MLRLLGRRPTHAELTETTRDELAGFAHASHHGWPERFADRVTAALAAPALPVRDYLVRAKATGIRLAAVQLLALHEARHDRLTARVAGEIGEHINQSNRALGKVTNTATTTA